MARLLRLTLHDFRGVRDLTISADARNVAIIGPNGSGKSSVADAIDFLLTGQLRRLTGEGAGKLSIGKHAPHIDSRASAAWVEAEFRSVTNRATVVLRRTVAKPATFKASGPVPDDVRQLLDMATQGNLHMLTRREIVRYICTDPGNRRDQLSALLDLRRIDTCRAEIQGAARQAADGHETASASVVSRREAVLRSVHPAAGDWVSALSGANALRARFGGGPLGALEAETVRAGLTPPTAMPTRPLYTQTVRDGLGDLVRWCEKDGPIVGTTIRAHVDAVRALHVDAAALIALRSHDLLVRGRALVTDGACPLCLTPWDRDTLWRALDDRITDARDTQVRQQGLINQQDALRARMKATIEKVEAITAALSSESLLDLTALTPWARGLRTAADTLLPDVVDGEVPDAAVIDAIAGIVTDPAACAAVFTLHALAAAGPVPTDAQDSWDQLTALETNLRELVLDTTREVDAEGLAADLEAAARLFVLARDEVLQATYDAIAGRFQSLYREVHGDDEAAFAASFTPTNSGLELGVNFHGRGEYPPSALHSEGHQDSMGICLFLALTDHLADGKASLLVLDDVLMSIDNAHRRGVANVLRTRCGDCQLFITTHDRVWWRQLQSLAVVDRGHALEFTGWNLMDGPILVQNAGEMLADVTRALADGTIATAAHALRLAIETYLPDFCDALGASVRYRGNGELAAGDYLAGAKSRYTDLVKEGRRADTSWGNSPATWDAIEARRKTVFAALEADSWAVNASVHFNAWVDFTRADFAPVVAAYQAFFALFLCPDCGGLLSITEKGLNVEGVRCPCGTTAWNLVRKTGAA